MATNWMFSCLLVLLAFLTAVDSLKKLDFFSSTLSTPGLRETHDQVVGVLRQYREALVNATDLLDSFLSSPELENVKGPWKSEGDPLRTFLLVRRSTFDLDNIVASIRSIRSFDPILEIDNLRQKDSLPSPDDFRGMARSLIRLQRSYLLQPKDMVQGNITKNVQLPPTITDSDCLTLGEICEEMTPNDTIPLDAKLWYQAGIKIAKNDSQIGAKLKERLSNMLNRTKKLMKFIPHFADSLSNGTVTLHQNVNRSVDWTYVETLFRRLCRGEQMRSPSMDDNNFCHLRRGPHPYMLLRPVKVEVKSSDPYLVVLHDIISNGDIEALKKEAVAKATRSTHVLGNSSSGATDIRVSATSWLPDEIAPDLAKRIGVFLGLNANASKNIIDVEEFQVLNYGVGGHYSSHRDYFENVKADKFMNKTGNRVATLMIYLSEVEEGGSTVFPFTGIALKPIKGAAAFWWNLRNDGQGEFLSTHGACPVIYGTKWVTNKWFRVSPQMFRIPCRPERQNDTIMHL